MTENPTKNAKKLVCFYARPNAEVFASKKDGKPSSSGYAATFNTYSEDLGGFKTKIAPGAFDKVLEAGADCRFLVNHNPDLIFGRTRSGTLRLKADAKGLHFEADPPSTSLWQHYAEAIMRGEMDGCSFTCEIEVDQWDFSGETPIRTLIQVAALHDVGPVSFPAFAATNVDASYALEAARASNIIKQLRPSLGLMRMGLELAR